MDVWSAALRLGIPTLDYRLLGRWIGHFPKDRSVHDRIAASASVTGELASGWLAHYAIGAAFAILLLAIWGGPWLESPTILPAIAVVYGVGAYVTAAALAAVWRS
jgi:hypothetical protein